MWLKYWAPLHAHSLDFAYLVDESRNCFDPLGTKFLDGENRGNGLLLDRTFDLLFLAGC